jgi:hypothetical protein
MKLHAQQHVAANEIAGIMKDLVLLADLKRASADLPGARDVRPWRYLEEMKSNAMEMMNQSLHHIATAFRYQYLQDVPQNFFNIDKRIDSLAKVALWVTDKNGRTTRRKNPDGSDPRI